MGVDIGAINGMKLGTTNEVGRYLYAAPCYEARLAGLDAVLGMPMEKIEGGEVLVSGEYAGTSWHSSYSTYNRMRSYLAQCAHGQTAEEFWQRPGFEHAQVPFGELISFSDCEGCIGPAASARLAKHFADLEAQVMERAGIVCGGEVERFLDFYSTMRLLFEHASDRGAVFFS